MASDPYSYGGCWTADTCKKVTKFVDLAEAFHLPIIYLVDCPGFEVGLQGEQNGTIKEGVRAMTAIGQTSVPWCPIIVRNAFGVAGGAHRNPANHSTRYAWPSARWGSLPLEGGIEAAYRADLDAPRRIATEELRSIQDRLNKLRSPFPLGGKLLDRGNHRPARYQAAAVRIRQPDGGHCGHPENTITASARRPHRAYGEI